jgi:hypothetical protein
MHALEISVNCKGQGAKSLLATLLQTGMMLIDLHQRNCQSVG